MGFFCLFKRGDREWGSHGIGCKPGTGVGGGGGGSGGGLELVLSVQHTSFPVAPVGRMLSWVS